MNLQELEARQQAALLIASHRQNTPFCDSVWKFLYHVQQHIEAPFKQFFDAEMYEEAANGR